MDTHLFRGPSPPQFFPPLPKGRDESLVVRRGRRRGKGAPPPHPRSAFVLYLSDGWNQATGGFVLVDLVGHVSAHGLDLNVPGVGIVRFICKPFLFWRWDGGGVGGKRRKAELAWSGAQRGQ